MNLEPVQLKARYDQIAPDKSEIYLLVAGSKGSLCQCVLPVGATSLPVAHRTVEELWYFVEGLGEVFRQGMNDGQPTPVTPGTSLAIPPGKTFQFRNKGDVPLKFMIVTMPPWPGDAEAITDVAGLW